MLEMEIISVGKPDLKKAAALLGPIMYQILERQRLPKPSQDSGSKLKHANQLNNGDSVA
jgi:hypothetical protein